MPDLKALVEPVLTRRSGVILDNDGDFVLPNYRGYGLANLPASISSWLGGPVLDMPPLAPQILEKFQERYQKVVFLLVDALGYNQLLRYMAQGKAEFWRRNLEVAQLIPLTSITPSTTASALTTIWTGVAPGTHGYIGYEMWMKELSMVINTILHMPTSYAGDSGSLAKAGFDPSSFLNLQPLGAQLASRGIESHAYMHYSIGNSGLSRMHLSHTNLHGYVSESDLWVNVRENLNARPNTPRFVYVYWSTLDTLIHRHGPDDERVVNQFAEFSNAFEENFINKLDEWTKQDTLFILAADHGAIATPPDENLNLANHPELVTMLRILPTCESRLPFLYIKPDRETDVRQYFSNAWEGKFTLITGDEAITMGLFGHAPLNPALSDRVGDLVAVPHGDAYLWWPAKPNLMQGRHGGLHQDEMLIPLYGLNLKDI